MRIVVFLAVLFLSGCSLFSQSKKDFSCPETGFVSNAAIMTLHGTKARIKDFSGECKFEKDIVKIDLTLSFSAQQRTAKAALKEKELPYFIAVLSPEETILQRKAFSTKIAFDKNGNGISTEEHVLKIPMTNPSEAYKYKVAVGFARTNHEKESK